MVSALPCLGSPGIAGVPPRRDLPCSHARRRAGLPALPCPGRSDNTDIQSEAPPCIFLRPCGERRSVLSRFRSDIPPPHLRRRTGDPEIFLPCPYRALS